MVSPPKDSDRWGAWRSARFSRHCDKLFASCCNKRAMGLDVFIQRKAICNLLIYLNANAQPPPCHPAALRAMSRNAGAPRRYFHGGRAGRRGPGCQARPPFRCMFQRITSGAGPVPAKVHPTGSGDPLAHHLGRRPGAGVAAAAAEPAGHRPAGCPRPRRRRRQLQRAAADACGVAGAGNLLVGALPAQQQQQPRQHQGDGRDGEPEDHQIPLDGLLRGQGRLLK